MKQTSSAMLSPHPREQAKWMPSLDGIRGLAILMVLWFHYGLELNGHVPAQHVVKSASELCWTGVDLFFVLSGFLITGILLDSRFAENYFRSFYARRILRIFPLYYLSLPVVFFLVPYVSEVRAASLPFHERIWYFVYLQNWVVYSPRLMGHYWSLALEEQFYLFWPLLVYRRPVRQVFRMAVAGSLLSLCLRLALLGANVDPEIIYRNTFTRMDTLLIGAACACIFRDPKLADLVRGHTKWIWAAPLAVFGFLRAFTSFHYQARSVQAFGFTPIALSFGSLLLSVALTNGTGSLLERFLSSAFMRTFGKFSYAIYIWHLLVRNVVQKLEAVFNLRPSGFPNVLLFIGATLVVSYCSYVLVERRFLRLKRFFEVRRSSPDVHPEHEVGMENLTAGAGD